MNRKLSLHGSIALLLCLLLCGSGMSVLAQTTSERSVWYVGVQGGVPFGISTFSSFGADKTRAGFAGGVYGGYRFNPVLSAEVSMKWGKTALSAQDCCIEKGYWLGADGNHYNAPVAGMNGWGYDDLKSSVCLQQYGVQLNVNLLGLFNSTKQSRWTVEVSPLLAAVGTRATIKTISGNADVLKGGTDWHLGAGGNLQAGYRITKNLSASIYSGINYLTGKRMDGVPEYRHKNNYIWESGVRIGWTFGKCGKAKATKQAVATEAIEIAPTICPEKAEKPAQLEIQPEEKQLESVSIEAKADKAETTVSAAETKEEAQLVFPTIYFGFNSTSIGKSEHAKLQTLLETLQQNPDAEITITGWCDTKGTKDVNARYSLRRAEAVKKWLVNKGIAAERIKTTGAGSDYNQPNAAKARRADTTEKQKGE